MVEQAKLTYFPLVKAFEKQIKTIEKRGKKQLDAITNQNKRLGPLTNKDDHKSIYKKIFYIVVKKRFDEITELTDEIDNNDLIYQFKNNNDRNFNDFNNGSELFKKIKSGKMNLKNAEKQQNVFESNLNQKSKKLHQEILNCFTNQEKLLLNYLINIL